MRRARFAAIISQVRCRLARQSVGMIEASATRRPVTPDTFKSGTITRRGSLWAAMRQAPAAPLAAYRCTMEMLLPDQPYICLWHTASFFGTAAAV